MPRQSRVFSGGYLAETTRDCPRGASGGANETGRTGAVGYAALRSRRREYANAPTISTTTASWVSTPCQVG